MWEARSFPHRHLYSQTWLRSHTGCPLWVIKKNADLRLSLPSERSSLYKLRGGLAWFTCYWNQWMIIISLSVPWWSVAAQSKQSNSFTFWLQVSWVFLTVSVRKRYETLINIAFYISLIQHCFHSNNWVKFSPQIWIGLKWKNVHFDPQAAFNLKLE